MPSNIIRDGSAFRLRRPIITSNGAFGDVDPTIKEDLDELNTMLIKRIFERQAGHAAQSGSTGPAAARPAKHTSQGAQVQAKGLDPADVLKRTVELTPKRTTAPPWHARSLVDKFHKAPEAATNDTLADFIDQTADLAALKYGFQDLLADEWTTLDYNTQTILDDAYPGIRDYLVAFAYLAHGLQEVKALKNFILHSPDGVAAVAAYAKVSAAREIIERKALKVPDYNVDTSDVVNDVKAAKIDFLTFVFEPKLVNVLEGYVFDDRYEKLIANADVIKKAKAGTIQPEFIQHLVPYVKNSPFEITSANIDFFLPLFISKVSTSAAAATSSPASREESERDFDVVFFDDDRSMVQVSELAVKCAAQLYYVMVTGDDLEVFDVVNYFTHKYLIRGGIEIVDARLRDDLQTYVFSNRFTDLKTSRVEDRTRPAERQMFYRQVFNSGSANVGDDVIVNVEFPKLWKVLILESAEYLERAQASFHPDSFVSRQKVMQAVEDLQYNLSTHCTGMANVIAPLINAELDFVIKRFFQHEEVLRQVAPVGSTWWRVVERLYMEMKHVRPKTTVLYNKAKLGHDIIASIAAYNPATFEGDADFSEFISKVDAFITTQSILQQALTDDLKRDQEEGPARSEGDVPPPQHELAATPSGTNGKPSSDEWDF